MFGGGKHGRDIGADARSTPSVARRLDRWPHQRTGIDSKRQSSYAHTSSPNEHRDARRPDPSADRDGLHALALDSIKMSVCGRFTEGEVAGLAVPDAGLLTPTLVRDAGNGTARSRS